MIPALNSGAPMTRTTARTRKPDRVEIEPDGHLAGELDELFAEVATVHLERMDDGHLWMRVNDHVVLVSATKRGLLCIQYEDDA